MQRHTGWIAALAMLAASCSHGGASKQPTTVSEIDLARVPEGDLGNVNQRRQDLANARDGFARAQLETREVQSRIQLAQADVNVAKAELTRADRALSVATQLGQQQAILDAQREKVQAQNHLDVENAQVDAMQAQLAESKAREQVAQRQVDLSQQQLEQAKYQALAQVQDTTAEKYSSASFQDQVANAMKRLNEAQATLSQRTQQSETATRHYQNLRQQQQAQQGKGQPRG